MRTGRIIAGRIIGGLLAGATPIWGHAAFAAAPGGSGGGPSVSAPSYDPAAEYRKGVDALKASDFKTAKVKFGHVLEVVPRDANTNYLAGLAAAGLGDTKSAQKFYERAVKADKELIAAHRELGLILAKGGDRAKAQAELDQLKAMQQQCGAGCDKAAELAEAVTAVSSAIAGAPSAMLRTKPSLIFASSTAGDSAYLEAVGLINEGRYEAAIRSLEAAQAAFGAHPDVLTYLGFANRKLGRYAVAEGYYRAALAAAPQHRAATEYYGELMVERGDKAGAQRMLASLESSCTFGCAEADELRRWIEAGHAPAH